MPATKTTTKTRAKAQRTAYALADLVYDHPDAFTGAERDAIGEIRHALLELAEGTR